MKGLSFRIHRLAEKLENLPVVKWVGHFIVDDGGSDGNDSSHGGDDGSGSSDSGDDGGTLTVTTD
jgi:hypothetical protein